ncbi:hypothetical protein [Parageobacillus toebii]|uniref:hypothetical protein n=1 Tax=Parageobacillus toebii TaxID=153151 RepID=UPI00078997BE|nr:hypothetical protein [Parageobacillus toebii]
MWKLSTFGKITFWIGCIFAVPGILGLFHNFLLARDISTSINYVFIGIMLISASFLYEKKTKKPPAPSARGKQR